MPKPQTKAEGQEVPTIRFTMITASAEGEVYALTEEGYVLAYNGPEQGWLRLAGDERRSLDFEPVDPDEGGEDEDEDDEDEE